MSTPKLGVREVLAAHREVVAVWAGLLAALGLPGVLLVELVGQEGHQEVVVGLVAGLSSADR